jgi:hypothetical protein
LKSSSQLASWLGSCGALYMADFDFYIEKLQLIIKEI